MATVNLALNSGRTHLIITRTGTYADLQAIAIDRVTAVLNPYGTNADLVRLLDGVRVAVEFATADSNLAGASTSARYAALLALLVKATSTITNPTEWIDATYPSDPPYMAIANAKFETTTTGNEQYTISLDQFLQPEMATDAAFVSAQIVMQAYEVGSATPVDQEEYKIGFYTGGGAVASIVPVRTRYNAAAATNYVNDFGYDGTDALEINVVNGSAATGVRFHFVCRFFLSLNT